MRGSKLITILFFLCLLGLLMFGFRTKPKTVLANEVERSLNLQSTDVSILKSEAIDELSSSSRTQIQILEAQLGTALVDSAKINLLKDIASVWYSEGQIGIAGSYAEEVANISESASAWAIAGTTYGIGIKSAESDKERKYCIAKSLNALENAISLNPDEVSYQLNRGIILAENPPAENPMKGVLMLLDLNKKYPKNVPVINNIAKFALQTGQLDKAEQRLLTANSLKPNDKTTTCLFAQLYDAKGEKSKADEYRAKCAMNGLN
ncbi:MAG: tetratricopeptide (TPR) repeat protein [Saprospiraceae bacterium]|jgi:tetratricopeptide (TPR) repeat protein